MSENLHDIDKLFKNSIEEHAEMPPSHVWNELDARLDKKNMALIAGKYNKLKWVAAALFLFSLGMAMFVYRVHFGPQLAANGSKYVKATFPQSGGKPLAKQQPSYSNTHTATPAGQLNKAAVGQLPSSVPVIDRGTPSTAGLPENKSVLQKDESTNKVVPTIGHAGVPGIMPASSAVKESGTREKKNTLVARLSSLEPVAVDKSFSGSKDSRTVEAAMIQDGLEKTDSVTSVTLSSRPLQYSELLIDSLLAHNAAPVRLTSIQPQQGLTVSVFFSPDLVANEVKNGHPQFPEDNRKQIKDNEQAGFSWSTGALLDYRLNTSWSVGSGLIYSNKVTMINAKTIFARPDEHGEVRYRFNCTSGYSYIKLKQGLNPSNGETAQAVSSSAKLQYISVPFMVKFNSGTGKVQFTSGGG